MWPTWQPSRTIYPVSSPTLPDAPDENQRGVLTVNTKKTTSSQDQKWLEGFSERFDKALAERPEVSDEDFLAETEVSDEEYALGIILPGVGNEKGETDD
jgi:hypothetical protein